MHIVFLYLIHFRNVKIINLTTQYIWFEIVRFFNQNYSTIIRQSTLHFREFYTIIRQTRKSHAAWNIT